MKLSLNTNKIVCCLAMFLFGFEGIVNADIAAGNQGFPQILVENKTKYPFRVTFQQQQWRYTGKLDQQGKRLYEFFGPLTPVSEVIPKLEKILVKTNDPYHMGFNGSKVIFFLDYAKVPSGTERQKNIDLKNMAWVGEIEKVFDGITVDDKVFDFSAKFMVDGPRVILTQEEMVQGLPKIK